MWVGCEDGATWLTCWNVLWLFHECLFLSTDPASAWGLHSFQDLYFCLCLMAFHYIWWKHPLGFLHKCFRTCVRADVCNPQLHWCIQSQCSNSNLASMIHFHRLSKILLLFVLLLFVGLWMLTTDIWQSSLTTVYYQDFKAFYHVISRFISFLMLFFVIWPSGGIKC